MVGMLQGNTKATKMSSQRFRRLHIRRMLYAISIYCQAMKFPVERGLLEITREQGIAQGGTVRLTRIRAQSAIAANFPTARRIRFAHVCTSFRRQTGRSSKVQADSRILKHAPDPLHPR